MIEPVVEGWTIVLVGQWNVSIFSPPWLTKHMFGDRELTMEFPLSPGLPMRITGAGIRFFPSPDRIMLNPTELGEDQLAKLESFACKLLTNLPHTPMSAIGINFAFKHTENTDELIRDHFPSRDDTAFSDRNMVPKEMTYIRSLAYEDWLLNLKAIVRESSVKFDFNFHANTPDATRAHSMVEGSVLKLKDKAEGILSEIYGLRRAEV